MAKGFWDDYVSEVDQVGFKELPFFHNTTLEDFEGIEENQWVLNSDKVDTFHENRMVFFFYGNPVYLKDYWDIPIVLGFKFSNWKKKASISPIDTGLIMNLVNNKKVRHSEKGHHYYKENFSIDVKQEELIPTLHNYIYNWFEDINNYCSGQLADNPETRNIASHMEHLKFINHELGDFWTQEEIKKLGFDFDKRRRTIELAIPGNVSLTFTCQIVFVGIPDGQHDPSLKERILKDLNVDQDDIDCGIYEYDYQKPKGGTYSVKEIMSSCMKAYHKLYDIDVKRSEI